MLTPEHPLSILILGLRTDLTDKQLTELGAVMGTEQCPWEVLLSLANLHRVTLLWYLRLQQHDLLRQMPADLRDYLAFYPGRVDGCFLDGERVRPQPGEFYGGWVTDDIKGPFKGEPGTGHW